MQEVLRAGGIWPLRKGGYVWSEEAFRRTFVVGDILQGYSGRVTGKITAIGQRRFLYKVTRHNMEFNERVGTIRQSQGWIPVHKNKALLAPFIYAGMGNAL